MADKETLRDFYDRRHPAYFDLLGHWRFLRATYKGGRAWFNQNIFQYHKEGKKEFSKRVQRAYRFNHTREAVDLVEKYLFKGEVSRNEDVVNDSVKNFWKNSTQSNLSIGQLIRQADTIACKTARTAIVVDNNLAPNVRTIADAKRSKARIYAYTVETEDILDYAWDEDGDGGLLWVKLRERVRDDSDPIESSGEVRERIRLWTRTHWRLFEETEETIGTGREKRKAVQEIGSNEHGLGVVPVVLHDHVISDEPYAPAGLIDDIAYLDRASANYLSNLDAIIQDQTFSQLVIPAQGILPGEDKYDALLKLGTERLFVYDAGANGNNAPQFISPDPKQAGVILTVIDKIINEIYHTIGLAGERTKQDNAVGIDNSSGVAKAYDFERVNSLLLAKAQSCQRTENAIVRIIYAWLKEEAPEEDVVVYPTTFDVMRLADDLSIAEALGKVQAPVEVRREQMRGMVKRMFPRLKEDIKNKIKADIDKWQEGADVAFQPPTSFAGGKPSTAPKRQGQVTKTTDEKKPAKA